MHKICAWHKRTNLIILDARIYWNLVLQTIWSKGMFCRNKNRICMLLLHIHKFLSICLLACAFVLRHFKTFNAPISRHRIHNSFYICHFCSLLIHLRACRWWITQLWLPHVFKTSGGMAVRLYASHQLNLHMWKTYPSTISFTHCCTGRLRRHFIHTHSTQHSADRLKI